MWSNRTLGQHLALLLCCWPAAAAADTGGPGWGGYVWADSDEREVSYEWVDVPPRDRHYVTLDDEDASDDVRIGFEFDFYGRRYSRAYIGSNGFIAFVRPEEPRGFRDQCPLPDPVSPNGAIFGFYQDLDPSAVASGEIYYGTVSGSSGVGRRFVVTFDEIDLYQGDPPWGSDPVTFQIVLHEGSGEIQVNVRESGALGGGARWRDATLIGVEAPDGYSGVGTCTGSIPDRYAVRLWQSEQVALLPAWRHLYPQPDSAQLVELGVRNHALDPAVVNLSVTTAGGWPATVSPSRVTLDGGGESATVMATVLVPSDATLGDVETVTVAASTAGEVVEADVELWATFPDDEWTSYGAQTQPRFGAAVAASGVNVFAAGGMIRNGGRDAEHRTVETVERFDPVFATWEPAASLPEPLSYGAACYMAARIYVAGGLGPESAGDGETPFVQSMYIYDVLVDEWTEAEPPPAPFWGAAAECHEASSLVYVVGGAFDTDGDGVLSDGDTTMPVSLIYDPTTDTWSDAAPPPRGTFLSASGLARDTLVVAGGLSLFSGGEQSGRTETMVYDTVRDEWSHGGFLPEPLIAAAGFALNGHVCLIGGRGLGGWEDARGETWCYAEPRWVLQHDALIVSRSALGAAALAGRAYVVGGYEGEHIEATTERWPWDPFPSRPDDEPDGDADGDADGDGDVDVDADADGDPTPPPDQWDGGTEGPGDGGLPWPEAGAPPSSPPGADASGCSCAAPGTSSRSPRTTGILLEALTRLFRRL
jgi:hypothetical protein